jgi:phage terminase large subunit-like protein
LTQSLTPRSTKYCPHEPHPTQQAFLLLGEYKEVFFGGAAGGGKSAALLMAALQYVDLKGYSAIIFRRTFPELDGKGGLIQLSKEWLGGSDATYNEAKHFWTFPSGAILAFGHMQHENNKYTYQGKEYHFIGFDELTHFTETQYTYMMSRLRRLEGSDIPSRVRATANPGGAGHRWVKARFVDPGDPQRPFIKSLLRDNPSLDQADYMDSLQGLMPLDRERLVKGDWDAESSSNFFAMDRIEIVEALPPGLNYGRSWDMAGTKPSPENPDPDWTAGVLLGSQGRDLYICGLEYFREDPGEVTSNIVRTSHSDGYGVEIYFQQDPGQAGKDQIQKYRKLLKGFTIKSAPPTGAKDVRAKPLAIDVYEHRVKMLRGTWNDVLLSDMRHFTQPGYHDDITDAASWGHRYQMDKSRSIDARMRLARMLR